jgi:pimeloyl-ACP methyl ester carboxylesterase
MVPNWDRKEPSYNLELGGSFRRTSASGFTVVAEASSVPAMATPPVSEPLPTGAEIRLSGMPCKLAVVCVNGGQGAEVPGTWSASIEWLVGRLVPAFPSLRFAEVRYRVKSWNRLDLCVEDTRAAIDVAGGTRTLLVGFSMGGAVAVSVAAHPSVAGVLGLAPWLPDELDLSGLRGRRLTVLHGALDRWLPGIPGVSPSSSRTGVERARRLGVDGSYTVIPGAVHGVAVRAPWGALVPLPRARRWAELAAAQVRSFQASA